MSDLSQEKPNLNLSAIIEGLLFVASEPVSLQQLAEVLNTNLEEIEKGLGDLDEMYITQERGLRIQKHNHKVSLTTHPLLSGLIEKFLGLEATVRLSRAALETLAIIAYRQPITRPGIDAIRGVNSDGVLKSLLAKELVREGGRAETPGRPIIYGTTEAFLQHFGLSSLEELPAFEIAPPEVNDNVETRLLKD
jgi:segregation and condensation protein B